jgi:hypothetical protein
MEALRNTFLDSIFKPNGPKETLFAVLCNYLANSWSGEFFLHRARHGWFFDGPKLLFGNYLTGDQLLLQCNTVPTLKVSLKFSLSYCPFSLKVYFSF